MLTKPLYLEIDKPNYVPIYTVQYDYNSRFYEITILNNSQPLDLTGIRVIVAGKKPDGKEVFNSCKVLDAKKGLIQLELTEQMNAVNGASEYALELFSADGMLSSQPFKLIVTRSTISKSVESSKELGALKDALNEVQDIDNRFAQTNAQLLQKANANEVVKKGYGTLSDFDEETRRIILGMEPGEINAVLGEGNVQSLNLANSAVNFMKLSDEIRSKVSTISKVYEDVEHVVGYVTKDGIFQDFSTYHYKALDVVPGQLLYVTSNCVGETGALAVFFDRDGRFVSNYKPVSQTGKVKYVDEPVLIPNTCYSVIICSHGKTDVVVKEEQFMDVLQLRNDVETYKQSLTKINLQEVFTELEYNLGYVAADGRIQTEYTSYHHKKVPMTEGDVLYVTANCAGSNGALVVFMDRFDKLISNYKKEVAYYVDEKIVAPAGCSYALICSKYIDQYPIVIKQPVETFFEYEEFLNVKENLTESVLDEKFADIEYGVGNVTSDGKIQEQYTNYAYKKIPVVPGETLYVTSNCIAASGALAVFMDESDTFVSNYKVVASVGGAYYIDEKVVVPKNSSYALICTKYVDTHPIVIKKLIDKEFTYSEFLETKEEIINLIPNNSEELERLEFEKQQLEERVAGLDKLVEFDWADFDKGYVCIVIDDGRHDLCEFSKIFNEYNMPLTCALMTSNLDSIQDDGRKLIDVALEIQANGGEVLSHSTSGAVFTEETTEEDANERLRTSKKLLTERGLIINGFVKPGGTGSLARLDKFEHLVRKYYRYGYSSGYSNAYKMGRYDLGGTFSTHQSRLESCKKNRTFITFYSHSFDKDEVTEATLRAILEYIRDTDGIELVTTKYLYDNFATTTLDNRLKALENKLGTIG